MLAIMLIFAGCFAFHLLLEHFYLRSAVPMPTFLPPFFIIIYPAHIFIVFSEGGSSCDIFYIIGYFVQPSNIATFSYFGDIKYYKHFYVEMFNIDLLWILPFSFATLAYKISLQKFQSSFQTSLILVRNRQKCNRNLLCWNLCA